MKNKLAYNKNIQFEQIFQLKKKSLRSFDNKHDQIFVSRKETLILILRETTGK